MTAQMRFSLVCPARHINSISFGSVCCRSLSTSTYDESVLTGEMAGGTKGRDGDVPEGGFRVIILGVGAAILRFRLAIFG